MKFTYRSLSILLTLLLLAACAEPAGSPTATSVLVFSTPILATVVGPESTLVPEATPLSDPMRFQLPTPGLEPVSSWRPPLYPSPWAPTLYDHFYFARPIAADEVNWPEPNYRYGGIFEEHTAHTGVDISAPFQTPVLAAGPGTVVWAGWGISTSNPGDTSDAYGQAVAIRHDFGYRDEPLYTIYAHLSETDAVVGQWVDSGDPIGKVGDTGFTTGPHLHFEVRLGANGFFATRNPELWLVPPQGWGVLAARIMSTSRTLLNNYAILIRSEVRDQTWEVRTYGAGTVISDPYYRENVVISDLPAGIYQVQVPFAGIMYKTDLQVLPGQVTYLSFQGFYGFDTQPPPALSVFPTSTP